MNGRHTEPCLVLGTVNVILPFVPVLIRHLSIPDAANPWKYFMFFAVMAFLPIVTSLMGIVLSAVRSRKVHISAVKAGGILSWTGLALQILFRFVLKI